MCLQEDSERLAVNEANRAGFPVVVVMGPTVILGIPGGNGLTMPAAVAGDAAAALLAIDGGACSCLDCRHALVCSQLSAVRHALTLRDYMEDGGEEDVLRAVAGNCGLFSPMECGEMAAVNR